MKANEMIQERLDQIFLYQDQLVEAWSPFLDAVDEHIKDEQDRNMNEWERRNLAQCLENAVLNDAARKRGALFEETTADAISFLGIQLPVISALLPSLALNDVAIPQAIDRRIAAVFYFNVLAGQTKGNVTSGDTLLSSTTGHNRTLGGRRYAATIVEGETIATGDGTVSGTVTYNPGLILLDQVVIKNASGTVLATCNSSGTISGTGVSGTINASGVYSITFTSLGSADAFITYYYQVDLPVDANNDKTGVPEVDFEVTQSTVQAIDFPVRSKYSIASALDLLKAHNINLESEVVKFLGQEIKFTIDQEGLKQIDDAAASDDAATAVTNWNATIQSGQEWVWKKHEILDRFIEGSNNILQKTLRAVGTFIVGGDNVARVVQQLGTDYFKPVAGLGKTPVTGPMKIGEVTGRTFIHNPFKSTNSYTMGFRGDNYLMAGFIFCPYIPLYTTPTITLSDLTSQKGFYSSVGFKRINDGMFTAGTISNLTAQTTG